MSWATEFLSAGTALLLAVALHGVVSYNIDTSNPIIITNLADGSSSYFGSSIEFIKEKDVSWIFIGSPGANSTLPELNGTDRPGVIWRCSFGLRKEICEVVVMDATGNTKESYVLPNGTAQVIHHYRHESMLGAAMATGESSAFVACGHNWANQINISENNGTNLYLNGICYVRPKKNVVDANISGFKNTHPQLLIPLANRDMQSEHKWIAGQAGFSAHMSRNNELLLGAPGVRSRRGSVIVYRNNTPDGRFGNEQVIDSLTGNLFHKDSYFGYSVSSGRFFNAEEVGGHEIQYVAGAPRGAMSEGNVIVFHFPKNNLTSLEKLAEFKEGEDVGLYSYYGSVICVVDINQDGYDDLLVAAPQYSKSYKAPRSAALKQGSMSANYVTLAERGDEGIVYVYMSDGRELKKQQQINGDSKFGARFGSAIASAGDVNDDRYMDVVVGAPFSDESTGSIYIYHGKTFGLDKSYAQAIYAREIQSPIPLSGFGYSFVPEGVDFDGNGHSDLIVGSFLSSQVVILRTRPFIEISTRLQAFPPKLRIDATESTLVSCLTFTGNEMIQRGIRFEITLELDTNLPSARIKWAAPTGQLLPRITYEAEFTRGVEQCKNFSLTVSKALITHDPIRIQQNINMRDTRYGAEMKRIRGAPTYTHYVIQRDAEGADVLEIKGASMKQFCPNCPILMESQKNGSSLDIYLDLPCGDDEKCIADFKIDASFEGMRPGEFFIVGSARSVSLTVTVTSVQDVALYSSLYIQFSYRQLLRIPKQCSSVAFIGQEAQNAHQKAFVCVLPTLMKDGQNETISFVFDMSDLAVGNKHSVNEFLFHLEVKSAVTEMARNVTADLMLPLTYSAHPVIDGSSEDIPFSERTLREFERLTHKYEINLEGPTPISYFLVMLKVPVNVTLPGLDHETVKVLSPRATLDGESMLCYARKGEFFSTFSSDKREKEEEPDSKYDEDEVVLSTAGLGFFSFGKKDRIKRDPYNTYGIIHSHNTNDTILDLNCHESKTTKCMEIVCRFNRITPQTRAYIFLDLLVYTHSANLLFEHVSKAVQINIESMGVLTYLAENGAGDKPVTAYSISRIALDRPKKVIFWYIIGALIGFFVLACIALALCYCGFFNRNKAPEEPPAEEDNLLEDENAASAPSPNDENTGGLTPIHEEEEEG